MQFSRKLLTSLFIGQYNVEKTQIPPPPLCQPRCRLIKKKKIAQNKKNNKKTLREQIIFHKFVSETTVPNANKGPSKLLWYEI